MMMYSATATHDAGLHRLMETQPMTLGSSPTHSPFLPGYLLGDKTPCSPYLPSLTRGGHSTPFSNPPVSHRTDASTPKMLKERIGTPPVKRLLGDSIFSPAQPGSPSALPPVAQSKHVSFNEPSLNLSRAMTSTPAPPTSGLCQNLSPGGLAPDHSFNQSLVTPSPAQLDPFFTQGEQLSSSDILDETWVTVFGFPQAAASYILQQFAQYGTIVKTVISTEGNWMHIRFQSKIQAKKALSKNGKVFGNEIMIGVRQCIDKSVMRGGGEESYLEGQSSLRRLPDDSVQFRDPSMASVTPTTIRPLTAAYQAARSENEMIPSHRVPHKNSTFVSKAMEYMFGW